MAIETVDVSDEQRDAILAITEDHFHDYKASAIAPASVSKTISAFANAEGGEIYIGVAETANAGVHVWAGFENPEAANGLLQVIETTLPVGADCDVQFLRHPAESGLVCLIQVAKTATIIAASDGIPRLRRGAQNLK